MTYFFMIIAALFWFLLLYYTALTIGGIFYRGEKKKSADILSYPSVSILIPAHNEAVVMDQTLHAMSRLEYPGELTIYVLNDNSSDSTGEIAQFYGDIFPHIQHIEVPPGTPKGKSRVLNYGLSISSSAYFAVYDADNQPQPDALRLLVEKTLATPNAVGAVGYVKTLNEEKNWLTRMISLEFQVFQLIMQSGRWKIFKTGSLTGTNMLVKRSTIEALGGYDPYALAEDADLTMRITASGGLLPIEPASVTWEQEPETFSVWLKQRTRWMQGNLYIIEKSFLEPTWLKGRALVHTLQQFAVYIGFVFFLLLSHIWFVLGLFHVIETTFTAPLLLLWFLSYLVYWSQLLSAQTLEQRLTPRNLLTAFVMYFTYAQMFLVLLARGIYFQVKQKKSRKEPFWDKTIRF